MEESYIASLDVGTTTVRCHIFNSHAESIGSSSEQVELLYPKPGFVEINPEKLWEIIVKVVKEAIKASKLSPGQITCIGICTQRCSFTHWNKKTGKSLHNFITWKDIRANKIVKEWNESLGMKSLRAASHCLYMVTRCKRFLAGSVLRIMNGQVTPRLYWALHNIPELANAVKEKTAMFGTVDTWLLYKLTRGKLHVSDVSNASATGMFDPFTMSWASWALGMFHLPADILPEVVDTAKDFGCIEPDIFGAAIPIKCSMADQSASMFGSCCFDAGDLKLTLGTGSFMNLNTGKSATANATGFYPVVAWRYGDELVYSFEGASNDTGVLIQWASSIDLFSNPAESATIAQSVSSNDGVYFIPAFSGLGPPINDFKAAAGFLGLKPTTKKQHMVRAILESVVFRVALLFEVLQEDTHYLYSKIRVDGGVSKNDFICQLLADMTSVTVERAESTEMSVLGAAYFAGLHSGIWKSKEELIKLRKRDREFHPDRKSRMYYKDVFENWRRVADRFKNWYKHEITEIDD